jgi:hypothetical protein
MAEPALPTATYEDLLALPAHAVGEIVCGVLYASPRPAPRHARASSSLEEELGPPFNRGRGGVRAVPFDAIEMELGALWAR